MVTDNLNREEQEIKNRQLSANMTILGGMALAVIGIFTSMFMAMVAVGVIVAIAGVGIAIYGGRQNWQIEKDTVEFKARKSSEDIIQSLQEQGVSLTPVQQAAIQSAEYQKTKEEWRDRIKADRWVSADNPHIS